MHPVVVRVGRLMGLTPQLLANALGRPLRAFSTGILAGNNADLQVAQMHLEHAVASGCSEAQLKIEMLAAIRKGDDDGAEAIALILVGIL